MLDYGKVFDDMYEYYRTGDSNLKQSYRELRNYMETYKIYTRDGKASCWMRQIKNNIEDRAGIIKASMIRGYRQKAYGVAREKFVTGLETMDITGRILKDIKLNGLTPKTILEIQKMITADKTAVPKYLFHFLPKETSKVVVSGLATDIERSSDAVLKRKMNTINNL